MQGCKGCRSRFTDVETTNRLANFQQLPLLRHPAGLWSLIKRSPKAKIKRKTFEVPGPGNVRGWGQRGVVEQQAAAVVQ